MASGRPWWKTQSTIKDLSFSFNLSFCLNVRPSSFASFMVYLSFILSSCLLNSSYFFFLSPSVSFYVRLLLKVLFEWQSKFPDTSPAFLSPLSVSLSFPVYCVLVPQLGSQLLLLPLHTHINLHNPPGLFVLLFIWANGLLGVDRNWTGHHGWCVCVRG